MDYFTDETELYHHGILGQKWGIRRYQNEDGTLTELGRKKLIKKDGSATRFGKKHWKYLDEETRNKEKQKLVDKGEIEELSKRNKKDFVNLEDYKKAAENRKTKITIEMIKKDPKYFEKEAKAEEFIRRGKIINSKISTVSTFVTNGTNLWDGVVKVTNTFGITDLPLIKEKQKDKNKNKNKNNDDEDD